MTSTTGVNADTTYLDYAPWVRVTLSGLTGSGTVTGHIYGVKTTGLRVGRCGRRGRGRLRVCGNSHNALLRPTGCLHSHKHHFPLLFRAHANHHPPGSNVTRIGNLTVAFQSAVTLQFEYGTTVSTACDTGTTALSGVLQPLTAVSLDQPFIVPAGQDLCVNLGSSVTGGGWVSYSQP